MMATEPVVHVDAGDLVVLSHEAAHLIVSTARVCGCHHVAECADGWSIVLGDGDSLPSWAVVKGGPA